ncbi:MAG: DUF3313 domain-containing protein [Pseudomonadales bacterium]
MPKTGKILAVLTLTAALFSQNAVAESGFMDDYSKLKKRQNDMFGRIYIGPNTESQLAGVNSLMVDQPEIFMSPASKYKGAKPDALKMLSDTLRSTLVIKLEEGGYAIADQPGSSTVYMRWAITDLYLKKKKRGLLAYTPVGFVVHSTVNAAVRDVWKKIDIVELSIEAEFIDSVTGEVLAAVVMDRGHRKDKNKKQKQELVSWEDLDGTMQTMAARLVCNLDNARSADGEREDCAAITVTVEE